MTSPNRFTVRFEPDPTGPTMVVDLIGQLDPLAAEDLKRELADHLPPDCRNVVFDMTRLAYVGSLGLQALIEVANRLKGSGMVCVAGPNENVRTVLELTKVTQLIPAYPTREDAVDAVRTR